MNKILDRIVESQTARFAATALTFLGGSALITKCGAEVAGIGYDSPDAIEHVTDEGYDNAKVTEVNTWFAGLQGCDKNDFLGFEITATNDDGEEVDLLVCKGVLKAATIRHR